MFPQCPEDWGQDFIHARAVFSDLRDSLPLFQDVFACCEYVHKAHLMINNSWTD